MSSGLGNYLFHTLINVIKSNPFFPFAIKEVQIVLNVLWLVTKRGKSNC